MMSGKPMNIQKNKPGQSRFGKPQPKVKSPMDMRNEETLKERRRSPQEIQMLRRRFKDNLNKNKVETITTKPIDEGHYGSAVNKIPKELDKAVALHKSQAERLRKSPEFKNDAGEIANKIPGQLDKAVAMHTKQAKQLRAAGVGDEKNCGCGQTPCKTYGKKKKKLNAHYNWRVELEEKKGQKCWPGYEKKGTKKMFGKTYNNCVKKK